MTSAAAGGRLTTPVYEPNTRLFARHTPLAAYCPMPIASDLHDALWVTFVVQALPAGPQHCHPRARVPVPGCSEVSQPGLPSCLMGCKVILDQGVDDESVCRRSYGGDR